MSSVRRSHLLLCTFTLTLFVFTAPADVSAAVIQRPPNNLDLVGYWPMDEGVGTSVGDMSGSGRDGATTGSPQWVDGKRGSALLFSGSSDSVEIAGQLGLRGDSAHSVGVWFKGSSSQGNALLSLNYNDSPHQGVDIWNDGNNELAHHIINSWSGDAIKTQTDNSGSGFINVFDGAWHHILITYDGSKSASGVDIYVDGQLQPEKLDTNSLTSNDVSADNPSRINGRSDDTGSPASTHNGTIDEVRVYSRALTANEAEALYNYGADRVTRNSSKASRYTNGLVGHWTFDGKDLTSATATDVSGNGNDGTRKGDPQETIGKVGQALEFDVNGDYINVSNDASLNATDEITLAGWVYPTDFTSPGYPALIEKGHSSQWNLILSYADSGATSDQMRLVINIGGSRRDISVTSGLELNTWHHVVATYNGSEVALYRDGTLLTTESYTGSIGTTSDELEIGRGRSGTDEPFVGKIDDARVYNRALSADEIKGLYSATKGEHVNVTRSNKGNSLSDGLVGHWTFDGPDMIGAVEDVSGNNNAGYLDSGSRATSSLKTIGKIGQGLDFNGSSDYINVADGADWDSADDVSVSVWVRRRSLADSGSNPVARWDESSGDRIWALAFSNSSGNVRFDTSDDGSFKSGNRVTSATALSSGTWYHVVAVHDAASGDNRLYIDGSLDATDSSVTSGLKDTTIPVTIGFSPRWSSDPEYYDGVLDDVRIYNRVLSAGEVKRLYNMGR